MTTRVSLWGLLFVLITGGAAASEREPRPKNWSVELGAMIGHHSNVHSRPNDNGAAVPTATMTLLYLNGELSKRWFTTYFDTSGTTYAGDESVSDQITGLLGVKFSPKNTRVAVEYGEMPSTEYAEEETDSYFDVESLRLKLRQGKSRKVWIGARYALERWTFDPLEADRDADVRKASATLRVPLGQRFGMRASYLLEAKDAQDQQYSWSGDGTSLAIEARPTSRILAFVRYRFRTRTYDDAPDTSSYFGRQDDLEDVSLNLRVQVGRHWGLRFQDIYRRVASNLPDRDYDAIQANAGVFVTF